MRAARAVALAAALALTATPFAAQGNQSPEPAPLIGADDPDRIDGAYIVVMEKSANEAQTRAAEREVRRDGQVSHSYRSALNGFAAEMNDQRLEAIRKNPNVAYVEVQRAVQLSATQNNATWGLDRIDQRNLPLDSTFTYTADGTGVHAYIVDTGIRASHNEFAGRVGNGWDTVDNDSNPDDCNGHGTHVAGTVGGTTYGVAKNVTLHGVRVLNCQGSGTNAGVIAGIDWVAANAVQPAVANMSLGGGYSSSINSAVANAVSAGITFVVAAGNETTDACSKSPASEASAITVASSTSSDARSSFSNYGSCVDVFAPGSSITSAWHTSNSATNTISGTSMASPHVAGVAALWLDDNPSATPAQVASQITTTATSGVLTGVNGSPNLLVYSPLDGSGGGTPPPPPPPSGSCGLAETYTGTLTGTNDYQIQPNGDYYYSGSGTHQGCLEGPASGADFDLKLYKWNSFWGYWQLVAQSISSTSSESINYNGSAGYYYWRIESYSGSGDYEFGLTRP